jgi:uncharacterized delta-60 repeat protein
MGNYTLKGADYYKELVKSGQTIFTALKSSQVNQITFNSPIKTGGEKKAPKNTSKTFQGSFGSFNKTAVKTSAGFKPKNQTVTAKTARNLRLSVPETVFTAGTVDLSFPNGTTYGFDGDVNVIKKLANGKTLVGGDFAYYYYNGDSYYSPYIIQLNADGTPDESFGVLNYGGSSFDDIVRCIDIQSDGKIIVGGQFSYYDIDGNSWNMAHLIRLTSDGLYDSTFNIGGGFNDTVISVVVQPDNKILAGGIFWLYNGEENWRIIRLQENGAKDYTFDTGLGIDYDDSGAVYSVVLQPDGKVLLGGEFYSYNNSTIGYNILRLNSDGSLDTSFITGDGFNGTVSAIALQSDGKIIVGGNFYDSGYYNNNFLGYGGIVRLATDGNIDTKFGYGFDGYSVIVSTILIQPDDKILVGGSMTTFYPDFNAGTSLSISIDELVRFNADCTFDYSFYYQELFNSNVYTLALEDDGKVLVGGDFSFGGDCPLNYFGRLNNVIQKYPYVYLGYECTSLYGEPRVVTVGSYTKPVYSIGGPENGYSVQKLSSPLYTNCVLAIPGSTEFLGYPTNIIEYEQLKEYDNCDDALIDNCKLVVGVDAFNGIPGPLTFYANKSFKVGDITFVNFSGTTYGETYMFHSTMIIVEELDITTNTPSIDSTPIQPYTVYESVEESVRANGQYVYQFDCYYEEDSFSIIHQYDLIPQSSPTYYSYKDNYTDCKVGVFTPSLFSDGEYYFQLSYISGGTGVINSTISYETCEECLLKTGSKGLFDYEFGSPYINGDLVYTMTEQPDGKVLVGGNFSDYDGNSSNNLVRITEYGNFDFDFNIGTGFNDKVNVITLQSDGKIFVGGNFNAFNGDSVQYMVRLNTDGSLDTNFDFEGGFDGNVRAIAIQEDGKILVGGGFEYYGSFYCNGLVRLNPDGTPDTTFVVGDSFNGSVYSIKINKTRDTKFYWPNAPIKYNYTYIVTGEFTEYNNESSRGIIEIDENGNRLNTFGAGFNTDTGETPRVNNVTEDSEGRLYVIGGSNNGRYLKDYNDTWIPQNIVRLVKNESTSQYEIDTTFLTRNFDNDGGFDYAVLTLKVLPDGKIMIGGQFENFGDNNDDFTVPYLIRLNENGSYDNTFAYSITSNYVNKVILHSRGNLLVGGWFDYDSITYLQSLFIGGQIVMRNFTTCDGDMNNIYLPYDFNGEKNSSGYSPISTSGLTIFFEGSEDDSDYYLELPTPFDVNFLGTNYTSTYLSSNAYLTFGGGNGNCCFDIPNQIPSEVGLPGVYISISNGDNPNTGMDGQLFYIWTGLTDSDNTFIVKYQGSYHSTYIDGVIDLEFDFKFYRDNSDYFDLIIEKNKYFFNNNPEGGTSDGINSSWIGTFDSLPETAYRIYNDGSVVVLSDNFLPIRANINKSANVCGTIGEIINFPNNTLGGSMYFDGSSSTQVLLDYISEYNLGNNDFTIEWYQYYLGNTSNPRPFSFGTYGNGDVAIALSFEPNAILWVNNSTQTGTLNEPIENTWTHFAITRYYDGGDSTIRLFQNGQEIINWVNNDAISPSTSLSIGNQVIPGDGPFNGYITNFRINNLTALYTSNFTPPIYPLENISNTVLLMLANNPATLITDTSGYNTVITKTNVSWNQNSPFEAPVYYTATNNKSYMDCDTCKQNNYYTANIYVRSGTDKPDSVRTVLLTQEGIDKINQFGPLFSEYKTPEFYELLNYYL